MFGQPKRKLLKLNHDKMSAILGSIPYGSVRYCTLHVVGDFSIRYVAEEETMKCSGFYGKH